VQFSSTSWWKPEIFPQSSKKMDQELKCNCVGKLSAIMTDALMLRKQEDRNVFGLNIA